jgi:hypothetical protein
MARWRLHGVMRCALALAALAAVARGVTAAEAEASAGPKPIKLKVDTIDAQLRELPAESFLLIEMFACVPAAALGALTAARDPASAVSP